MNKKIPQIVKTKKLSKIRQIENHLLLYGSITVKKSIKIYGIDRIPSYINTLRNRNWDIDSIRKTNPETWWVLYQLKNYPNS